MNAESVNAVLKGVSNFGGIFDVQQLENVKILSLPVTLIVNDKQHWIAISIDEEKIEIMDSIGQINNENLNIHLCRFLCAHAKGKNFIASPKLQSENSEDCGKYVISFIIYKSLTQKSLRHFLSIFTENFRKNSKNISKIFETVKRLIAQF